jgi:8-oxo-dGTP pyrophosphatase MutT (NUDIX family)
LNHLQPKILTLVIPVQGTRCLLGMKKRGFGTGYWNGFGGKVEEEDASVLDAAMRELEEEANISGSDAQEVGRLCFSFEGNPQPWLVHVFRVESWSGSPTESEEMRPEWFDSTEIPFDQMWADDRIWWPAFLSPAKRFSGIFCFKDTTLLWQMFRQEEKTPGDSHNFLGPREWLPLVDKSQEAQTA